MAKKYINHFLVPPSTEVSPFLASENQLVICNGVNPSYKLGTLIKDLGYSKVGSTLEAGKSVTGLHHFRQSPSSNKILATINNTGGTNLTLQYNNSGTWAAINVGSTYDAFEDALTEMEDFLGYCFIVGYDSTDSVFLPVASLTGTTFSTSTNVTSMPQGKYIKRYRDRLYVANCFITATAYPYRVYFSSVPTAGAITWTVASDFIDVDFSEQITGISENWDKLIIFTEFSAYMYDQSSKKKVWDIGCGNHRSIQTDGVNMIWANKDNVWVSTGGKPESIGNDVLELLRTSSPTGWRSAIIDNEYHLYVGSCSANGISYTNCLLTYNINTSMWRWRELYDSVTALCKYTSSGDDFLYMGVSDGMVHVKSKYTDTTPVYADDGQPILAHWRTGALSLDDPTTLKKIQSIFVYSEFAVGMNINYRIFNKNQEVLMPMKSIGNITQVINNFTSLGLEGYFIQFEGKEYSENKSFKLNGMVIEYV